ncbi:DUF2381 family protein [Corallococcus sp. AB004]|nr:DUF2381 family protein [Corallococcus sp. AB038B]RKI39877.1 DUF2381 family protein [Corallococcus sp. AB004]
MLLVFRPLLLLSLLLLGMNVTAQEPSRGRELVQRRVTLAQSATGKPVELHVASGSLTREPVGAVRRRGPDCHFTRKSASEDTSDAQWPP